MKLAWLLVSAGLAFEDLPIWGAQHESPPTAPIPKADPVAEQKKRESLADDFARQTDKWKKMVAARYLVLVGDPNPIYFEYLDNLARTALEGVGPYPFVIEPPKPGLPRELPPQRGELSPEYVRWSAMRKLDRKVLPGERYAAYVSDFLGFATLRDSRTRPLLRKALTSENIGFVQMAIGGLAAMGNLDDIDSIVQSVRSRVLPERQECYATLEMHTRHAAGTARLEAALSTYDPEGLAFYRELRRQREKLDKLTPPGKERN